MQRLGAGSPSTRVPPAAERPRRAIHSLALLRSGALALLTAAYCTLASLRLDLHPPRSLCARILSRTGSNTASCTLLLLCSCSCSPLQSAAPARAPLQRTTASPAPATWALLRAPSPHARARHENRQRLRPTSAQPTRLTRVRRHGQLAASARDPSRDATRAGHDLVTAQLLRRCRPPRHALAHLDGSSEHKRFELPPPQSLACKERLWPSPARPAPRTHRRWQR